MEGDIRAATAATLIFRFLSTPSGWRATPKCKKNRKHRCISIHALRVEGDPRSGAERRGRWITFLSTPSGWRATPSWVRVVSSATISIHALRVEGDDSVHRTRDPVDTISIHALRVEGDRRLSRLIITASYFYPRPPGGGRPDLEDIERKDHLYFYPRPPGGGRQLLPQKWKKNGAFLSTPSGWRATFDFPIFDETYRISIHALRVEGDTSYGCR